MALLEGKVALVTRGSYGIGLAAAQAFAEEGAVVYITGRDEGRRLDVDDASTSGTLLGGVSGSTRYRR